MTREPSINHARIVGRPDYQAVNRRGVTVYTTNERAVGVAWVKDHQHLHDGLVLEVVEVVEHRRVAYRPRPRLALVGVS